MKLALSRWILLVCSSALILSGVSFSQIISFGMRKLASSTNQFGLDLMRSMDRSDPTMAFCPFCISSSLAMLLQGSHGPIESSLRHALYLWGMQSQEINLAYYDMMNHLGVNLPSVYRHRNSGLLSTGPPGLKHDNNTDNDIIFLNNIYVQRDYAINYHYHILMQRFYKTPIHPLDFVHNGEETRQHINAIVEMQTDGKVKDILPERRSAATQLLLLSALYFQGTLDLNIALARKPSTNMMPINLNSNHKPPIGAFGENVVMLESRYSRIRHGHNSYLNCTAIEMPFKGGIISLVAIMPHDPNGLDLLLTRMSAQMLNDVVRSLDVKRVTLRMPKLNFEKTNNNLTLAFMNMGLTDIFKPGYANLYRISDNKWLHVSDVIHKTLINIQEIPNNSNINAIKNNINNNNVGKHYNHGINQGELVNVDFDKPFLYFIMDNISGLILVMGKVGREMANYRLPI